MAERTQKPKSTTSRDTSEVAEAAPAVTEAGGIIFPPIPAFYMRPTTIEELVDHSVGRALDQFDLHVETLPRWNEQFRRRQLRREVVED